MSKFNPTGDVSDEEKGHTPDKLRNDDARWKDRDMPDEPEDRDHAEPQQYDRGPHPGPDGNRRD